LSSSLILKNKSGVRSPESKTGHVGCLVFRLRTPGSRLYPQGNVRLYVSREVGGKQGKGAGFWVLQRFANGCASHLSFRGGLLPSGPTRTGGHSPPLNGHTQAQTAIGVGSFHQNLKPSTLPFPARVALLVRGDLPEEDVAHLLARHVEVHQELFAARRDFHVVEDCAL